VSARGRLPNRRECESFQFRHAGLDFTLCAALDALGEAKRAPCYE